jgi:hypothetical protein
MSLWQRTKGCSVAWWGRLWAVLEYGVLQQYCRKDERLDAGVLCGSEVLELSVHLARKIDGGPDASAVPVVRS